MATLAQSTVDASALNPNLQSGVPKTTSSPSPSILINTPTDTQNRLVSKVCSTSPEHGDLSDIAASHSRSADLSEETSSTSSTQHHSSSSSLSSDGASDTSLSSTSSLLSLGTPRSFQKHRRNAWSVDCIPEDASMKGFAPRPPMPPSNTTLSLAPSISDVLSGSQDEKEKSQFPRSLAVQRGAAARLHLSSAPRRSPTNGRHPMQSPGYFQPGVDTSANIDTLVETSGPEKTPSTARFPLQSPCLIHQRFDEAVNIDKVLEEISDDDWISHSSLMQTATGVREVSKQLQRKPIRSVVRSVMIITKARDNRLVYLTRDLAQWLLTTPRYGSDVGVNVYVDAKLRHSKRFNAPSIVDKDARFASMLKYWTPDLCWESPENFDLVVTLGGDGTVLFTSWLFQRVVPPILPFSLGSLGFLTTFGFEKYKEHLNHVMGDAGMLVNLRMRFTCTVFRQDRSKGSQPGLIEEREQFEILNELVIDRGPSPYVSNLELYGDNELLTVVQADGCIFSTPTGSTAYSLSAGGSLVHPSIPAILLTPICPHTLSSRPMVLSDTLLLRIAVPQNSRSTAWCAFDGKGRIELKQGDYVTLEASPYPFPTVMSTNNEWIDSIQRALRWNERGAVQKGWDANPDCGGEGDGLTEKWDIDIVDPEADADSGVGQSEDGIGDTPIRQKMALLGL